MAGELLEIGTRPRLVASFTGVGAEGRFIRWRGENAGALERVPPAALRVEYGRAAKGLYVRVRIDEAHLPEGLAGPDEAGAAAGLPPRPSPA